MHLKNGTLLKNGTYRIERFINSDGFGCTYEAWRSDRRYDKFNDHVRH